MTPTKTEREIIELLDRCLVWEVISQQILRYRAVHKRSPQHIRINRKLQGVLHVELNQALGTRIRIHALRIDNIPCSFARMVPYLQLIDEDLDVEMSL